jgi:ubiquinone/menaquinone biosynthesis C-methylase UbiE
MFHRQKLKAMYNTNHYKQTKEFFKISALEKQGYYDAKPGQTLKHNPWQQRIRKMALVTLDKLLKNNPGTISKLIDAGCGRGDFAIEIAQRYPNLNQIYGSDFSKETISIARQETGPSERVIFCEADLLNMPFQDGQFDITLCINVLHHIHINDLANVIKELTRITKRYLILEIKNNDNFYYRYIHPTSFGGITVYPTSIKKLNPLLETNRFHLKEQRGIFVFNWLSPLVLLLYEKP